jgi:hypothetical protein
VLESTLELRAIAETDEDFCRRAPRVYRRAELHANVVTGPMTEPPEIGGLLGHGAFISPAEQVPSR